MEGKDVSKRVGKAVKCYMNIFCTAFQNYSTYITQREDYTDSRYPWSESVLYCYKDHRDAL